jgi:ABC-type transport system involved in multi-copper enzyme maturation permease subunit
MLLLGQGVNWLRFTVWLTPIWLIGVGVLLGLLVLLLLWGLLFLIGRRAAVEVPLMVREGPLWPIFIVMLLLISFVALGWPIASKPQELLGQLTRMPFASPELYEFEIPAPPSGQSTTDVFDAPLHELEVDFRRDEVRQMRFESNRRLMITPTSDVGLTSGGVIELEQGQPFIWKRTSATSYPFSADGNRVRKLLVRQMSGGKTTLRVVVDAAPADNEQLMTVPYTAIGVVGLFLLYFLHRTFLPRLTAIALSTTKSEMANPVFWLLIGTGCFLLVVFHFIPYYTLGDDIIMYKNSCLTLIMVVAIFQAVWTASQSISEEIEGKTALTVLSKPIGRWQFIVGKFTGIVWTVAVMSILLGLFFLIVLAHKPIYDAREASLENPLWQQINLEVVQVVPGLVLAFFETVVMASISVAISTRLPMLANFVISITIYIMGHLTPLLVQSSVVTEQFEPVVFVGRLISTVLPVLEYFNIQAGVAGGAMVPLEYLGMALVYCLLYSTAAMLLSLVLFEDRDLA